MRKIALISSLLALTAFVSSVSAQLILQPLSTFGPNGDGTLRPGDLGYTWLTSDGSRNQRGMAYNPATGHLIVVDRTSGAESINVIDALTGTYIRALDLSGVTLGGAAGFVYDQVAVADDGAIYVGNLTTSGTLVEFILYRWENEAGTQTRVYGPGDPGNGTAGNLRWGDTLAARGTGLGTEVLIASRGTVAAVLRPTDSSMASFSATTLTTTVPGGALGFALCFGPGNTFYGKSASGAGNPLYHLSYDATAGTATTLHVYSADQFPGRVGALMVEPVSNLLAAVEFTTGTQPDIVSLYDISTPANPPVLLDRKAVANMTNANSVFTGAAAFGGGSNVFALNSDNGLAGFAIGNGSDTLAARVFTDPQPQVVQLTSNAVFTVGADGTAPLAYQWRFNGADIANATASGYTVTNSQPTNAGSYSVVVTNNYGSVTSAVATLIVLASYGNTLFYDPFAYAPGSALDGQGGWGEKTGNNPSFAIAAGNVNIPYLAPAGANHVVLGNGNTGVTVRKQIGTYTQGALYFSFAMKIDDLTYSGSSPSETTAGLATGTGTTYTPKINIEKDNLGHYTIGIYKGSGTTVGGVATNADGSTMLFTVDDTVFVVGRIVFGPGGSDDTCDLWINPDPSTFGAASPPTPSIGPIGAGRTDVTPIDHFVFRDSSGYNGRHFDEVRCGFDWASVTPPAAPEISVAQVGTNAKMMWPTNISSGYQMQSLRGFKDVDGWQPVTTPVIVEGVSNTVTVPIAGNIKLFRLQK